MLSPSPSASADEISLLCQVSGLMRLSQAELEELLMGLLHALTAALDAKDPYGRGHSYRVAMVSKRLAERCGLDDAKARELYLAGLLHDVGKIGVPERVLQKEGRLSDEEYGVIKRHPAIGATIFGGVKQMERVTTGIVAHHERPDGKGYPDGLKGDEIPIEGLIVGLADGFDAMTSDRTYRKALPLPQVVAEIRAHAGTQFDPDLVERLLSLDLTEYLEGLRNPMRSGAATRLKNEQKGDDQ